MANVRERPILLNSYKTRFISFTRAAELYWRWLSLECGPQRARLRSVWSLLVLLCVGFVGRRRVRKLTYAWNRYPMWRMWLDGFVLWPLTLHQSLRQEGRLPLAWPLQTPFRSSPWQRSSRRVPSGRKDRMHELKLSSSVWRRL